MTNEQKVRFIFRKHSNARFDRSRAYWAIGEEFYGFKVYALKSQLMAFFKDFSGLERSCRKVLQEKEFALPPENQAKIQEKKAEFRIKYKENPKYDFGREEEIETLKERAEREKMETHNEDTN